MPITLLLPNVLPQENELDLGPFGSLPYLCQFHKMPFN